MIDVLYAFAAIVSSMRERKSGLLINLSSVVGNNIYPGGSVYFGTKFTKTHKFKRKGYNLFASLTKQRHLR